MVNDPDLKEAWSNAFRKEFRNLAQGYEKTGIKGTNTIFVMSKQDTPNIPKDCVVTYARIVVNFCQQKDGPNRVQITTDVNLIVYPVGLTTCTADLATAKVLRIILLSTENVKYMCIDIKNIYLATPMD